MIVEPKVREFICTTAHPEGCRENVKRQIAYVKEKGQVCGPKKVLVIGASTGYGLASRITAAFACQAATIGIMFEKPSNGKRTATPGWYNTAAFEELAQEEGLYAKSINGDAFSAEVKQQAIDMIRADLGQVDMVDLQLGGTEKDDCGQQNMVLHSEDDNRCFHGEEPESEKQYNCDQDSRACK